MYLNYSSDHTIKCYVTVKRVNRGYVCGLQVPTEHIFSGNMKVRFGGEKNYNQLIRTSRKKS